ncbi:MAG TPA: hypothetical protein VJN19_01930 [Propionibacteriaceae bacterium]|nr:hypothetical protein [Propionibacteriaceae bacterium]
MPNSLFADLMTAPVVLGDGSVDVAVGIGVAAGCDGVSLGGRGADSAAVPVSRPALLPHPANAIAQAASTAMRRIRINSLPSYDRTAGPLGQPVTSSVGKPLAIQSGIAGKLRGHGTELGPFAPSARENPSSRTRSAAPDGIGQADVVAHIQPSPDRRLGSLQINPYAEDRGLPPTRFRSDGRRPGFARIFAREREELAGQLCEVIEVHAGDEFVESPV